MKRSLPIVGVSSLKSSMKGFRVKLRMEGERETFAIETGEQETKQGVVLVGVAEDGARVGLSFYGEAVQTVLGWKPPGVVEGDSLGTVLLGGCTLRIASKESPSTVAFELVFDKYTSIEGCGDAITAQPVLKTVSELLKDSAEWFTFEIRTCSVGEPIKWTICFRSAVATVDEARV